MSCLSGKHFNQEFLKLFQMTTEIPCLDFMPQIDSVEKQYFEEFIKNNLYDPEKTVTFITKIFSALQHKDPSFLEPFLEYLPDFLDDANIIEKKAAIGVLHAFAQTFPLEGVFFVHKMIEAIEFYTNNEGGEFEAVLAEVAGKYYPQAVLQAINREELARSYLFLANIKQKKAEYYQTLDHELARSLLAADFSNFLLILMSEQDEKIGELAYKYKDTIGKTYYNYAPIILLNSGYPSDHPEIGSFVLNFLLNDSEPDMNFVLGANFFLAKDDCSEETKQKIIVTLERFAQMGGVTDIAAYPRLAELLKKQETSFSTNTIKAFLLNCVKSLPSNYNDAVTNAALVRLMNLLAQRNDFSHEDFLILKTAIASQKITYFDPALKLMEKLRFGKKLTTQTGAAELLRFLKKNASACEPFCKELLDLVPKDLQKRYLKESLFTTTSQNLGLHWGIVNDDLEMVNEATKSNPLYRGLMTLMKKSSTIGDNWETQNILDLDEKTDPELIQKVIKSYPPSLMYTGLISQIKNQILKDALVERILCFAETTTLLPGNIDQLGEITWCYDLKKYFKQKIKNLNSNAPQKKLPAYIYRQWLLNYLASMRYSPPS